MILEGLLKEGDALPSVRTVATDYRLNPLTVLKAYQELVDENLVEMKRGRGMYVNAGAPELLMRSERQKFLQEEWPRIRERLQRLGYAGGVHPRFDRAKAEGFLARTSIKRSAKVRELSKGMVTQLHLALVMAVDARLLVLDEPTLGLDILYRKKFYDSLLNDYFDRSRTIVVTTHQVEEVQHVLTDLMFINRGRIVLACSMEEIEARYVEVLVNPEQLAAARGLKPMHERQAFGRSMLLFHGVDRQQLAGFGEVHTPSIADLFVAVMGNEAGTAKGSAP